MSAIAGIYLLDGGLVDQEDLERMVARIAHRGLDGEGCWINGTVGLGHRLLNTTPESIHEKQPVVDAMGQLAITADARIDNRDELIGSLGIDGHVKRRITDAALILRAYEKWGEDCPAKLLGDFAFAIWDGREHRFFCARDHFGVKPFYYYHRSGSAFVFGSEIKALLCIPEVPRRLNETRVAEYLVPMLEDEAITFYQEIFRLPPGHSMTLSAEKVSVRPYWFLDPSRELRLRSDEEYAEAFRELFTEAVRCRLRSAFPVGSLLSGGLDSSSIVCVARKLLPAHGNTQLHTFSAIYDEVQECDERPFIKAVLAQNGLKPHYVHADRLSPLTDLDRVFYHQDEPFWVPNLFMFWGGLYSTAHGQGVRVLLDGMDGDTTVSHGLAYLEELARSGRWVALAKEVTRLGQRFNRAPWWFLWRYILNPLIPEPIRKAWRSWDGGAVMNREFARHVGLPDRAQMLRRHMPRRARISREGHWRELTSGLNAYALEVLDKAASAFSIEPRYPFFDKRLAEFCLALPPEQKLYQGWNRVVMRRAMEKILPEEVRWRGGKADLSPNFTRGLLAFERGILEDVILRNPQVILPYVDTSQLREAYKRYLAGTGYKDALTIWKTVTLALWLRQTRLAA